MQSLEQQFKRGLILLNLDLTTQQQQHVLAYLQSLQTWNKTFNLTAIRDISKMLTHHILDSLALSPFIVGETILDVGTGAGLPGIPLAIAQPERHFTLLDANGKKTRFLTQVAYELKLNNVTVCQDRVENFQTESKFTTIVSRAFSDIAEMLAKSQHLCCTNSQFLLMKGMAYEAELASVPAVFNVKNIYKLDVPFLDKQRVAIRIKRSRN